MPPKSAAKAAAPANDPAQTYSEHDIVLAKVKGYPPWPGRVVNDKSASKKVLKDKPTKGKNLYLVQFFPTGDFAWASPRDISLLKGPEIDKYIDGPKKGGKDLIKGYKIAKDPQEWITEKEDQAEELRQYEAALEDDELASEPEPAAATKKGAKGGAGAKKETTKKRKRESTATNGTTKKDEKKKPKKDTTKTKAGTKKDYTDDEAEPASKKSKASGDSDAETVKGWRHKLQKIFLGKTDPPADEMSKCAEIYDAMEKFEMKKDWLLESKLAKVLKRVALLKEGAIPDEDKYNFRKRSSDLAAKWAPLLEEKPEAEGTPAAAADASTDAAPATENGTESAPAASSSEEKKEESAPMDVDTNGDADKAGEEPKKSEQEEEEPKKDGEAPAAESSA